MKLYKLTITGTLMVMLQDESGKDTDFARSVGSVRIGPDGTIERFPKLIARDRVATSTCNIGKTSNAVLAHELGHVVGAILQTPAYVNDPRGTRGRSGGGASEIVASEREAWEIGGLIYPGMDWLEADRNLATYDNPESRQNWDFQIALMRMFLPPWNHV